MIEFKERSSAGRTMHAEKAGVYHPFTNLAELAKDRDLLTPELFTPNDFYGHAAVLKQYCGLNRDVSLKASIEHALFFNDYAWEVELQCDLPAILVTSSLRFAPLRKRTKKAIFAIGPLILYAPHALSSETLDAERKRLGKSLLVMPSHSTHHITAQYDINGYRRYLERAGREFDSVRVCLYWKDVLLGRDVPYREAGFECVTAGHMFDPLFLPRLRSIIESASVVTSNVCGTHVGLCVALHRPHVIAHQAPKDVTAEQTSDIQRDFDAGEYESPQFREVEQAFSAWTDTISARQADIVNRYWGLEEKRTREELRMILRITEDMYATGRRDETPAQDAMERQIESYRTSGRHGSADYLTEQLRRLLPQGEMTTTTKGRRNR